MDEKAPTLDLSGDIDQPLTDNKKSREKINSFKQGIMALTLSNIQWKDWIQKRRESVQPWTLFLNTSKFKLPKSIAPVGKRIVANIEKFQSNYMFVFIALVVFCILTSPMLLVALGACLGACYFINTRNADKKIFLGGREISVAQQYAAVGLISFPLFWIVGAGAAVFWVIGASFFAIMIHASMYSLDDEQEPFEMEEV